MRVRTRVGAWVRACVRVVAYGDRVVPLLALRSEADGRLQHCRVQFLLVSKVPSLTPIANALLSRQVPAQMWASQPVNAVNVCV